MAKNSLEVGTDEPAGHLHPHLEEPGDVRTELPSPSRLAHGDPRVQGVVHCLLAARPLKPGFVPSRPRGRRRQDRAAQLQEVLLDRQRGHAKGGCIPIDNIALRLLPLRGCQAGRRRIRG